jgi:DNA-binding NarL/FixJ family response regulator
MRSGALGGLSSIRRFRAQDSRPPILVLTKHSDPVIVSRALEVGATGYVLKDSSADEVLNAFRRVRGSAGLLEGLCDVVNLRLVTSEPWRHGNILAIYRQLLYLVR